MPILRYVFIRFQVWKLKHSRADSNHAIGKYFKVSNPCFFALRNYIDDYLIQLNTPLSADESKPNLTQQKKNN